MSTTMPSTNNRAPGRLGDPNCTIDQDPRADPRMIAAMAAIGMTGEQEPTPVTAASSMEDIYENMLLTEAGFGALGDVLTANSEPAPGVTMRTETITGVDGNDISLYIHTPDSLDGPVPCVVHLHGGGMVIMKASDTGYNRWRNDLAATGMIVIGVEFRNGGGELGPHPFPAGLNDCGSAVRWAHANRENLGASKIVVSGESGGGNLSIATSLLAKRDGWLDMIDGVYAQCPYIAGAYADPPDSLGSLQENDGYLLGTENMGALARPYDPTGENATNPLAWPWHATTEDVAGLPPYVISVNELDPLRDEGMDFYRTLVAAGVNATGRMVLGTCHAGDCLFHDAMPDVVQSTLQDIHNFATNL